MSVNPLDVPPYQLQSLVSSVLDSIGRVPGPPIQARCAQALGSEIYVGCTNGELLRFALQANGPDVPESYTLLSRQGVTHEKPVQEIMLLPSLSRALVLADHQVFIYTLPSLDVIPSTVIKPIRNVLAFVVDEQHLRRPPLVDPSQQVEPVEFCVIKRSGFALYSLRERLFFQKEVPLPPGASASVAKRTGHYLCFADKENYNMVDLEVASLFPLMPISQAIDGPPVKPSITVISDNEFLICSWTGTNTLGLFITGDGDPVRGTLEWSSHPEAVCLDYPYITTLLPNGTIDIHNLETQAIVQVVPAPPEDTRLDRRKLVACAGGFLIPSTQRSEKLRRVPVRLLHRGTNASAEEGKPRDAEAEIPGYSI